MINKSNKLKFRDATFKHKVGTIALLIVGILLLDIAFAYPIVWVAVFFLLGLPLVFKFVKTTHQVTQQTFQGPPTPEACELFLRQQYGRQPTIEEINALYQIKYAEWKQAAVGSAVMLGSAVYMRHTLK